MDWLDWVLSIVSGAVLVAQFVLFITIVVADSDWWRNLRKKSRLRKKERLLYELSKMGVKVVEADLLEKVQNRNAVYLDKSNAKWEIKAFLRFRYSDEISSKTMDEIAEKIAEHYTKRRGKDNLMTLEELMHSRLWFDGCYVSESKTDEE